MFGQEWGLNMKDLYHAYEYSNVHEKKDSDFYFTNVPSLTLC